MSKRLVFAAVGAGATIFGAVVARFSGLQFRFFYWLHDTIHSALTGYHTGGTFLDLFILPALCAANSVFAAVMALPLSSRNERTRLLAIGTLGIQAATLLIGTGPWNVYTH